ncbi:MAG: ribonuclease H family protein [Saprospiraceae bacterium]
MAKKQKFYVVWKGKVPGIYRTWEDCQKQIFGFSNPAYKSYDTLAEANFAYSNPQKIYKINPQANIHAKIEQNSISVDAACSGNPGIMEYRGVYTHSKETIFHKGPYKDGTNNIGEFLGIVHALALCKKNNESNIIIYSDSMTAIAWVRNKKANTKLELTKNNEVLFDLIKRAELWLKTNDYSNKILKWDTKAWGEIPADFGRK